MLLSGVQLAFLTPDRWRPLVDGLKAALTAGGVEHTSLERQRLTPQAHRHAKPFFNGGAPFETTLAVGVPEQLPYLLALAPFATVIGGRRVAYLLWELPVFPETLASCLAPFDTILTPLPDGPTILAPFTRARVEVVPPVPSLPPEAPREDSAKRPDPCVFTLFDPEMDAAEDRLEDLFSLAARLNRVEPPVRLVVGLPRAPPTRTVRRRLEAASIDVDLLRWHPVSALLTARLREAVAYVSLARLEEIDLGALQALSIGCPVVGGATAALGHHLSPDYPYLVPWRAVTVGSRYFSSPLRTRGPDLDALGETVNHILRDAPLARQFPSEVLCGTALGPAIRLGAILAKHLLGPQPESTRR